MEKSSLENSKNFEAKTLDDVYKKASDFFKCSANNLDIDIIQAPSKGFFGFFAKNAIVSVLVKNTEISKVKKQHSHHKQGVQNEHTKDKGDVQTLSSKLNELNKQKPKKEKITQNIKKEKIFNEFYDSKENNLHDNPIVQIDTKKSSSSSTKSDISEEIATKVNELMGHLCYEINVVEVSLLENNVVLVEFSGADSALLIGKEGYRYKALSYILFNWISDKYSLTLRLEIAEFLQKQEQAIFAYLEPIIETIKNEGFFKTKVLDGILIHIALEKLRIEFPDKYVAIKTTRQGDKYILVNEYRK